MLSYAGMITHLTADRQGLACAGHFEGETSKMGTNLFLSRLSLDKNKAQKTFISELFLPSRLSLDKWLFFAYTLDDH